MHHRVNNVLHRTRCPVILEENSSLDVKFSALHYLMATTLQCLGAVRLLSVDINVSAHDTSDVKMSPVHGKAEENPFNGESDAIHALIPTFEFAVLSVLKSVTLLDREEVNETNLSQLFPLSENNSFAELSHEHLLSFIPIPCTDIRGSKVAVHDGHQTIEVNRGLDPQFEAHLCSAMLLTSSNVLNSSRHLRLVRELVFQFPSLAAVQVRSGEEVPAPESPECPSNWCALHWFSLAVNHNHQSLSSTAPAESTTLQKLQHVVNSQPHCLLAATRSGLCPIQFSLQVGNISSSYLLKLLELHLSSYPNSKFGKRTDSAAPADRRSVQYMIEFPLHAAAQTAADPHLLSVLHTKRKKMIDSVDSEGNTPLHIAARFNCRLGVVSQLLKFCKYASISLTASNNDGRLPMHNAASGESLLPLRTLLTANSYNLLALTTIAAKFKSYRKSICRSASEEMTLASALGLEVGGFQQPSSNTPRNSALLMDSELDLSNSNAESQGARFGDDTNDSAFSAQPLSALDCVVLPTDVISTKSFPTYDSHFSPEQHRGWIDDFGDLESDVGTTISTSILETEQAPIVESEPLSQPRAVPDGWLDEDVREEQLVRFYLLESLVPPELQNTPATLAATRNFIRESYSLQAAEAVEAIRRMGVAYPGAFATADLNGCLPFHIAALSNSSVDVVRYIFSQYPKAVHTPIQSLSYSKKKRKSKSGAKQRTETQIPREKQTEIVKSTESVSDADSAMNEFSPQRFAHKDHVGSKTIDWESLLEAEYGAGEVSIGTSAGGVFSCLSRQTPRNAVDIIDEWAVAECDYDTESAASSVVNGELQVPRGRNQLDEVVASRLAPSSTESALIRAPENTSTPKKEKEKRVAFKRDSPQQSQSDKLKVRVAVVPNSEEDSTDVLSLSNQPDSSSLSQQEKLQQQAHKRATISQVLLQQQLRRASLGICDGCLPLHLAAIHCDQSIRGECFSFILDCFPEAAQVLDCKGQTALHYLLHNSRHFTLQPAHYAFYGNHRPEFGARVSCLRRLLKAFPEAVALSNQDADSPLDLLLHHYKRAVVKKVKYLQDLGISVSVSGLENIVDDDNHEDDLEEGDRGSIVDSASVSPMFDRHAYDDFQVSDELIGRPDFGIPSIASLLTKSAFQTSTHPLDFNVIYLNVETEYDLVLRLVLRHDEQRQDIGRLRNLNWKSRRGAMYLSSPRILFKHGYSVKTPVMTGTAGCGGCAVELTIDGNRVLLFTLSRYTALIRSLIEMSKSSSKSKDTKLWRKVVEFL